MNIASILMEKQESSIGTYFTIQGNIGCGKSTFLEVLKTKIPDLLWIQEPVKEWQQLNNTGINMLDRYYTDPKRWGFTFQIYAIFTRLKKMKDACDRHPQKIKISERSILADKYVFAELMKDLEFMDASEYEVYKSLYQTFQGMAPIQNVKIIYLRCSPEKCYERSKKRKRAEQKQIEMEYFNSIHKKHEQWFKEYDKSKVLVIDTTEDFIDDEIKVNQMMNKLNEFVKKLPLG